MSCSLMREAENRLKSESCRFLNGGNNIEGLRQKVGYTRDQLPLGATLVVRAEADYYNTLGVSKNADKKSIKSAYRQKARKFHPVSENFYFSFCLTVGACQDVNKEPGAEDKFKKIGEAYEVLSDDSKRQIYDQYGEEGLKSGMGGFSSGADFTSPLDLFEQFFGGGMGGMGPGFGFSPGSANRAVAGDDLRVDIDLAFLDAVFGCAKDIDINHLTECNTCNGSGVKAGTSATTCAKCGGQGQVVSTMRTPLGVFQQVSTCPSCQGTGQSYSPCDRCGGDGRLQDRKTIQVQVPAGIDNGSRLRVRGEGNAGLKGGPPGDLYVFSRVKSHPELRREGTTIHSDVEISYVQAILGTAVKIPTVDGEVELQVPSGTQPETTLLMSKRGVPKLGKPTERGDHKVHVRVTIPKKINAEERKLVEKLREMDESRIRVGPWTI